MGAQTETRCTQGAPISLRIDPHRRAAVQAFPELQLAKVSFQAILQWLKCMASTCLFFWVPALILTLFKGDRLLLRLSLHAKAILKHSCQLVSHHSCSAGISDTSRCRQFCRGCIHCPPVRRHHTAVWQVNLSYWMGVIGNCLVQPQRHTSTHLFTWLNRFTVIFELLKLGFGSVLTSYWRNISVFCQK